MLEFYGIVIFLCFIFYCVFSSMHNYMETGRYFVSLPRFRFGKCDHTIETKMYTKFDGDICVFVTCTKCGETLCKENYSINRSTWENLGRYNGFYRAEETTQRRSQQQKPPPKKPSNDNSWWKILNVSQNATKDQINGAWKKLAAIHHPDKPKGSHKRMAEINNARDIGLAQARA